MISTFFFYLDLSSPGLIFLSHFRVPFFPPTEARDVSKKNLHLAFSLISGSSSFSLVFELILIFHSSPFFLEFDSSPFFLEFDLNFVCTDFDFSFFSVFARFCLD